MSRSGCAGGSGIDSSGEGGIDGSRCGGGVEDSGFEGGEAIEAGGKVAEVKAVVLPTEIDGAVCCKTARGRLGFLDDGFRC